MTDSLPETKPWPPEKPLQGLGVVGPYRLLQQIGEGGMGTVWMAEQSHPVRRRVALKLIKADRDSKEILARFEAERQALAMMNHQNIAKVLDAGVTADGRPYFAMELVQGIPLTEYCDKNRLRLVERLTLFMPVCHAIQHAHQKGIIHRDIKPSNVLVSSAEDYPVPKVIDFGLAKALDHQRKLTDRTMYTEFGQVVGTINYMSPEQAEMNAQDVDTRTDIYALGVMLYELLTGTTPLQKELAKSEGIFKLLQIIREQEPPRPSHRLSNSSDTIWDISDHRRIEPEKLQRLLRGDLDCIVMKALDRDRTRRYETAAAFADDVRRYLNDEPVIARPPSAAYRIKKLMRKYRGPVAATAVIFVLLIAGVAATSFMYFKAAREREQNRKVVDAFVTAFQSANPGKRGVTSAMLASEVLERALRDIEKGNWSDDPLTKATLQSALGKSLHGLGVYDEAIAAHRSSFKIRAAELGDQHTLTIQCAMELGDVLRDAGQLEEAISVSERALELCQEALGTDAPMTLRATNILAASYQVARNYKAALPLLKSAWQRQNELLGADDPATLASLNNLAAAYQQTGDVEQAIPLAVKVLEKTRRVFGLDSPRTLTSLGNLAAMLHSTGRVDEALPLLEEALELTKAKLGPDHPATLGAMNNLAAAYGVTGRLAGALPLFEETLERMKAKLGNTHPSTNYAYLGVQATLLQLHRYDEADAVVREWIQSLDQQTNPDIRLLAQAQVSLAESKLGQRDFSQAQSLAQKAVSLTQIPIEEKARARMVIAACLAEAKDVDAARTIFEEAYSSLSDNYAKFEIYKRAYLSEVCEQAMTMCRAQGDAANEVIWSKRKSDVEARRSEER